MTLLPGEPLGADDFVSIWIFVVLKAGIRDLQSQIAYIKGYGMSSVMATELGYYLTSLELATGYIHDLNEDQLTPDEGLAEDSVSLVGCVGNSYGWSLRIAEDGA